MLPVDANDRCRHDAGRPDPHARCSRATSDPHAIAIGVWEPMQCDELLRNFAPDDVLILLWHSIHQLHPLNVVLAAWEVLDPTHRYVPLLWKIAFHYLPCPQIGRNLPGLDGCKDTGEVVLLKVRVRRQRPILRAQQQVTALSRRCPVRGTG